MIQTFKTTLTKKTKLTSDVFIFDFTLTEPINLSFIPGQYMVMDVVQANSEVVKRLYSIASSNSIKNSFELMIKIIPGGIAGEYLSRLEIGHTVNFQGPAGVFVMRESVRSKVFLVTGTGIAPILSMLRSSSTQIQHQMLLWGLPYYNDVCLFDELKQLHSNPLLNFQFKICLSREPNLEMVSENDKKYFVVGRITAGLDLCIQNAECLISNSDFYLCSGRDIIDSLKALLFEKGVPKEQVFFEKF